MSYNLHCCTISTTLEDPNSGMQRMNVIVICIILEAVFYHKFILATVENKETDYKSFLKKCNDFTHRMYKHVLISFKTYLMKSEWISCLYFSILNYIVVY